LSQQSGKLLGSTSRRERRLNFAPHRHRENLHRPVFGASFMLRRNNNELQIDLQADARVDTYL
jgi:hypothetical protein